MAPEVKHSYLAIDGDLSKIDQVVKRFCDVPRSQLRGFFQNECVTLNGKVCTNPGTPLKAGDRVEFCYQEQRRYKEKKLKPKAVGYRVVFEDGHLIVVDKEAGLLTVSTRDDQPETLAIRLSETQPLGVDINVVHRLDRDTSGLLVFAKSRGIAAKLKEQFASRKPERVYDAFVRGRVEEKQGTFKSYLATDKDLNMYSVRNEKQGKLAITHYLVHQQLKDATWVKVRLETGRRNQIRVHFAEVKHPVLGDVRYQPKLADHPEWRGDFLALHASTLGFVHPATKKKVSFESKLPARMLKFLAAASLK